MEVIINGIGWQEEGGLIRTFAIADGTRAAEWVNRLVSNGVHISDAALSLLKSPDFRTTKNGKVEMAIIKGSLFENCDRSTKNVFAEAEKRRFFEPSMDMACLLIEKLSARELELMGLWTIIIMHKPIKGLDGSLALLSINRINHSPQEIYLGTRHFAPTIDWGKESGFAFTVI